MGDTYNGINIVWVMRSRNGESSGQARTAYINAVEIEPENNFLWTIVKNGGYNGYKKPVTTEKKTVTQLAKEVIDGKWSAGEERRQKLTVAGYNYSAVQKKVNELCEKMKTDEIANEVI